MLPVDNFMKRFLIFVSLAVCIGVLVPADIAVAHQGEKCARTYVVKRGDSWSRIAGRVKVPMKDVLTANHATMSSMLLIGDVICLPKNAVITDTQKSLTLPPPKRIYSPAKSKEIIREIFPAKLVKRALEIVARESNTNAAGYNFCCVGLFQINFSAHRSWLAAMGVTRPEQLLDAYVNVRAAYKLYQRSGSWAAWN